MKDRKIKPVSFSHVSEYDSRLLAYAESKERGNFSQYVKRLIDEDMSGVSTSDNFNSPIEVKTKRNSLKEEIDREAMGGFL